MEQIDPINQMITLSVITLSSFHYTIKKTTQFVVLYCKSIQDSLKCERFSEYIDLVPQIFI
jgi:hypothetical protein